MAENEIEVSRKPVMDRYRADQEIERAKTPDERNIGLPVIRKGIMDATHIAGMLAHLRNECRLTAEEEMLIGESMTPAGWYFLKMALVDPKTYMALLARLMPKDVNLNADGAMPTIRIVAGVDESKV